MNAVTNRIATDHLATSTSGCTCGGVPLGGSYPRHVAEVTLREAAARLRLMAAEEFEDRRMDDPRGTAIWDVAAWLDEEAAK